VGREIPGLPYGEHVEEGEWIAAIEAEGFTETHLEGDMSEAKGMSLLFLGALLLGALASVIGWALS
jgi:hypothetical protein